MITKITGTLIALSQEEATIGVEAFEYEVSVPEHTRRQLQGRIGQPISLFTIYQLDGNATAGKLTPRLIGFLTEIEREFFDLFCSVDGVGTRKALRAMVRPVPEVAAMIEEQDHKGLSSLPGIGPAMSERIVAKLRRKVPKFALMVVAKQTYESPEERDVVHEVYSVLTTLGHSEAEAHRMVEEVRATKKKFKDPQEMINAIYDRTRKGPAT
jgi:Holliday junction DNA helicase RuvA